MHLGPARKRLSRRNMLEWPEIRAFAQELADEMAAYMVEHRAEFVGEYITVEEAVERAVGSGEGPICLLDMGDNVGGGSSADSTLIAHEIHRRGDTTAFVCLYDRVSQERARQAGLKIEHVCGMSHNPITKRYWLGDDVDVNYLMHTSKAL